MSLKKYSFLTLFVYGLSLLTPSLLIYWGFMPNADKMLVILGLTFTPYMLSVILCSLLGVFLLTYFYRHQNEPLTFERKKFSALKILLLGSAGIFLSLVIQNYASLVEAWLFQSTPESKNTQSITEMILKMPIYVLVTTVTAPIMEEFVFRRAILGFVSRYANFFIGAVISSLFFAIAHQDGHLLIYFSLGFFFSLLYYFSGSIWTSVVTHIGMNLVVILLQFTTY
ncbi:CAAX protease [Enterococcus sp. JM4C]|uniref:CPBP family intramembrane glutamic endopeptidase n=1 Tax=Candidatus Enterococcus huntleyi TaxID=1857217 RepID=UPI00137ABFC5|nr:type II CAAX endopeptidase family protein [Enterococcus sp. JM4C]KAF1299620.1 CAAX protease [Enterococcus sp. JM4C]